MRYWDSSALAPLLVEEANTARCESLLRGDPQIATWWLSRVECASALSRLRRDRSLDDAGLRTALSDLDDLSGALVEIRPTPVVRTTALRLLRVHPLTAADALQLAAAILAAGNSRSTLDFISYDVRLVEAAEKEGFQCSIWPEPRA